MKTYNIERFALVPGLEPAFLLTRTEIQCALPDKPKPQVWTPVQIPIATLGDSNVDSR
nr:hypothetical protein [Pseudomonas sp. s4]